MPNSLIINGSTVINSLLDHAGRIGTFSTAVNVGNTAITPTSITVQSLVVGSISTSGAGGSSTGFNITGNGSFTGALSAGSLSTIGTFSAGNTVFNGTVTLGNIGLQNGSITVGGTTINTTGMVTNGIGYGGTATVGFYSDTSNLALRPPVASGTVFFQTPGGASSFATFSASSATINSVLNLNGTLNINTGNISIVAGQLFTDYTGNGGVRLVNGGVNNTGYIEFRGSNTAAPRLGYIGFGPSGGGAISLSGEGNSYFNFIGNAPQVNGSPIVSNATLASQLGGYVQTATLTSSLSAYAPLSGATFTGSVAVTNGAGLRLSVSGSTDWLIKSIGGNRLQFCDSASTVEFISFGVDGTISTRQFGDLNSRIEARGQAWGAWGRDQAVTSFRMAYIADLDITANYNGGMAEYYGGSCVTGRASIVSGDGNDIILRNMRFRQNQIYIAAQGWVAAYFA